MRIGDAIREILFRVCQSHLMVLVMDYSTTRLCFETRLALRLPTYYLLTDQTISTRKWHESPLSSYTKRMLLALSPSFGKLVL